jgi:hypothetical protein
MNKTNRFHYANEWFTTPFRAMGYWVEDAAGKNVCEAASLELAKALALTLNYNAKAQAALEGVK